MKRRNFAVLLLIVHNAVFGTDSVITSYEVDVQSEAHVTVFSDFPSEVDDAESTIRRTSEIEAEYVPHRRNKAKERTKKRKINMSLSLFSTVDSDDSDELHKTAGNGDDLGRCLGLLPPSSEETAVRSSSLASGRGSSRDISSEEREKIVKDFFRNRRRLVQLSSARKFANVKISRNERRGSRAILGREDGDGIFHELSQDVSSALSLIENDELEIILNYCIEHWGTGREENYETEKEIIINILSRDGCVKEDVERALMRYKSSLNPHQ